MAARSGRHRRGERARKRARLRIFGDLVLLSPALVTLALGGYSRGPSLWATLFVLLAAIVVVRSGVRRRSDGRPNEGADFVTGLAGLTALLALIGPLGGLGRELYPVVYALLAFIVTFSERRVAWALLGTAAVLEVMLATAAGWAGGHAPSVVVIHLALLGLFTGLQTASGRRGKPHRDPRASLERRDRLARPDDELSFAETASDVTTTALALLQEMCGADLAAFLELTEGGALEVVAATDPGVLGRRVSAREGVAASVLSCGQPVLANRMRGAFPGSLDPKHPPRHVLAAPVGSASRPDGVLLLERREGEPFGEPAPRRAQLAAGLLGATLLARRRVARVTDAHDELERFFDASRLLNSALTPEQVYASANEALGRIAPFAFAAITWSEGPGRPQRIAHARGLGLEERVGARVDRERTLAAMVVKNGHYLPLGCEYKPEGLPVVAPDERLRDVKSVIVLPLRVQDQVRGTLAVGAVEVGAFPEQRRGILEVIANQMAVALANARTYARVQELATVDGLTGLFNRRTFERRLGEGLARAGRSRRPLSLVLLDIDHFKSINDTHGHPTGDAVLRELGATIRRLQRRTDLAARYGGEEFVLILEDTDASGAFIMAERLREEAAGLSFEGAEGRPFGITISLGVAGFPSDATAHQELIDRADSALYEAKRGGRDQTRLAQQTRPQPSSLSEMRAIR